MHLLQSQRKNEKRLAPWSGVVRFVGKRSNAGWTGEWRRSVALFFQEDPPAGPAGRRVTSSAPAAAHGGRPALGARADPRRGDAGHRPDRDRLDDHRDRGAVDRRGHRRVRPVPLAVLDLPAGPGGLRTGVRQARRPVRAQAGDPVRDRPVPARLGALRRRLEHGDADRLPGPAGPRRRRDRAGRDHDRRRHLLDRERAKAQGYIASVWGIAAVVGPTLGGLLSEYASWRWIFFVNIPLACWPRRCSAATSTSRSSAAAAHRLPGRDPAHRRAGAGHPGLLEGGGPGPGTRRRASRSSWSARCCWSRSGWSSGRAPEPVLPLWVFRRRLLVAGSLIAAGVGAIVLGLTSYVPTYVQEVLGTGRWSPGSRWPRCRWAGRSPRPRPARSTCASASATAR